MKCCDICEKQTVLYPWSHGTWCKECSEMMLILNWSLPMPQSMDIDGISWLNTQRREAVP